MFKITRMYYLFGPFEGFRFLIADLGKSVYGTAYIPNRVGAQVTECLPPQYAKPAFHLIEP
jgi:hypothetical protein